MNAKRKGNGGELELLHILQAEGLFCFRNQQGGVGGQGNPDVSVEQAGHRYHIEVKRCEKLNLTAALRQAENDAVRAMPVVAHRRNREGWLCTINLKNLITLMRERQRTLEDF